MLLPTSSSPSLPKTRLQDQDLDLDLDSNEHGDHASPLHNAFDNSRPSSPAPASSAGAEPLFYPSLCVPARVLSPKLSLDVSSPSQSALPATPTLRTPPESPIKDERQESSKRQSWPYLVHQHVTQTNGLSNLSSPPSSPTEPSAGAPLPPKLSQSLVEHPLFRGCTPAGILQLASRMHIRHYHPQDHIIRRSEQSSAMFYVLRGTVKVVSHDNEATYNEIKEHNFFGDVGVLYRVPRTMDVLAKNRCTIAILSGEDLVKAMEQSPEMAKAIGYQSQERYQIYLKRRQSISARRTLDGGTGTPDQCQDDSCSDSFVKSDVHSAIRKVPLFQSCSTEVIHLLSLKVEPRTYNLGESIIRRGEIGREMYFIVSGVVEILSDDNLRVLARFREGQFFGEIACLLDVPRIANVKAVSQVEVFVLTKDNLQAVFQAVPGAAETITAAGNRLYQNWLLRRDLLTPEEELDESAKMFTPAPNIARRMSGPGTEGVPMQNLQEGGVGAERDASTDQLGSSMDLSPGGVHSIDPRQPEAISVLPMTLTDDFAIRPRFAGSPHAVSPFADEGPLGKDESPFGASDSSMDTGGLLFDSPPDVPMNRNPTIRGLQESTPKRRRASVAVWSQQDLLKLAEAANAKSSIDKTHTPVVSSAMAAPALFASHVDSLTEAQNKPALLKRSSTASLTKKRTPPKKLTRPATLQDLDESTLAQVLSSLPLNQLLRSRSVCKEWNRLILEHEDVLQDVDLAKHKKIVTDAVLIELCTTVLSKNAARTKRISLRDCFLISDKGLSVLATHMPAVQELDLHSCWNVTDAGFRSLGQHCQALVSIDFSNCRKLGDETIFSLYPKEQMLKLNEPSPTLPVCPAPVGGHIHGLRETVEQDRASPDTSMDEAQVLLTRRPSIEMDPEAVGQAIRDSESGSPLAFDVDSPKIAAVVPSQPSTATPGPMGCPLLARLNLSYCKNLTDRSFIHLSLYGAKRLEYLNLQRCTTITSEAFISLNLYQEQIDGEVVRNSITDLEMIVHEDYRPLIEPCFPRLRELHLSDCTFLTDDAIVALAPNMPHVEVVSLSFCCALTDVAVEALCEHCLFLEKIDLSFCGSAVSDASLYQLARFDALEPGKHSLKDLEIRGCVRVTERGVREILKGCANLEKLNVSSCSGIGTGDLVESEELLKSPLQDKQGEDTVMSTAPGSGSAEVKASEEQPSNGWASLPSAVPSGELARKMNALKRGKEWARAQQRPGLQIIV
ncbi:hypothetical protein BGZ99_006879 [Dissophora globulifera]|uniref:Cyclic nucleotide-binding domain-containing protein n=1 Tax=Dissophora globulifera TaxID=979702 RepID=A0A9P6UZN1_9FUNG|nr:hypothetical protein BGZ99_006879 [Dissophora globulifera]